MMSLLNSLKTCVLKLVIWAFWVSPFQRKEVEQEWGI
jgi:hypothetical protein